MKRIVSALVISLLIPELVEAQDLPARFSKSNSRDSVRAQLAARIETRRFAGDTATERHSHAVRNGAIVSAVIGAVAGGYGGGMMGTGCYVDAPLSGTTTSCHANATHNQFIIAGAVVGGLAVGLVGAGLGKIWQLLE